MPFVMDQSLSSDIMIVDDNPANLKLLEEMLEQQSYTVRSFPLGRLALAAATKRPPDLILLDVNMPEMSGYEVCERLKANAALSNIPVIFLSALDKTEDKLRAFQAGAADYVAKPFQFEEVQARVKTHLILHGLQRAMKRQNVYLEDTVAARTHELAEANERLTMLDRSKSEFLRVISHEFRTPLNGILGVTDLLLEEMSPDETLRRLFVRSRRRMLTILDDAMLLTEIDVSRSRFRPGPVFFPLVLARAMEIAAEFANTRGVTVQLAPVKTGFVFGDEGLLVKALQALLETAIKFSVKGEIISLSDEMAADRRRLFIESTGPTIPDKSLAVFFDLFSIVEAIVPGGDLGLGPPVAYRILSLFGASVSVENRALSGIRFTISLKYAEPNN